MNFFYYNSSDGKVLTMSTPALLIRNLLVPRQTRRPISNSSGHRNSTSPQRKGVSPHLVTSPKRFKDIPGPLALPMLRHSAHVLPRIGNFHHAVGLGLLEGLQQRYGNLVRLAKGSRTRPVLYVFDPEIMKEVYDSKLTEPPMWERSPLYEQRKTTTNQSSVQGDQRKEIWAAIRILLLDGTLQRSFDKAFDDIAEDFTRRIGELRYAENALNEEISTEIYRWALESIGVMVFGGRLGCLDGAAHIPTHENRPREKTSLDDEIPDTCSLSKRCMEELTPAEQLIRISLEISNGGFLVRSEDTLKKESETFKKALKTFDDHYALTEHFLLQAMQSLKTSNLRPEQILVDKLRPLQNRVLPLVADILLAGVDPLAQTALGMFYQLSLNAARQQRAHDEVAWAVASRDVGSDCAAMPYISACAREALRIHPATGGVVRRSTGDMVVAGYEIPEGVDIVLAHGVSSKDEKQWGRAMSFVPERWCSEGWEPLKASRAHPSASMPFGENCPATGMVCKMLTSLATRVFDKYRIEWQGPPPNVVNHGVNKLQPPYYFVLQNAA